MNRFSYQQILTFTKRVPFTSSEFEWLLGFLRLNGRNNLDTEIRNLGVDMTEFMSEGFLVLGSPLMLKTDIVYVKIDAGKGFFGGQKSMYATYVGNHQENNFEVGPTFKSWGLALTGINNLYRGYGFLHGSAR